MKIQYVYETGLRKPLNEDAILARSTRLRKKVVTMGVICDGMGGVGNGALASGICVSELEKWYDHQLIPFLQTQSLSNPIWKRRVQILGKRCIYKINRCLFEKMRKEQASMGTTMTMLLLIGENAFFFHIGDSRLYRFRSFFGFVDCRRITTDHAKEHRLTRCLGLNPDGLVDVKTWRVKRRDIFLLCCDGFWHFYDRDIWKKSFGETGKRTEEQAGRCLESWADYVMKRGERDNISALLLWEDS